MTFNGKTVLLTGGTGSFGKVCSQYLLDNYDIEKLIIFSRDELKQYEMQRDFTDPRLRFFIGDVRDANRLDMAFSEVNIVIHAAAMKHITACEYNPFEAIKTNVLGAQNIIEAALAHKVERVLALSTDKAANPINLYGATKLCSDKLFTSASAYVGKGRQTRFAAVRYGNVIGSRGSVIPLFERLRETGKVPVTDPRMTRFWITLDKGVRFVCENIETMQGGEIFVPKLQSMNIMDLVKAIAPDCDVEITGIRAGEKLHEVLITHDDCRHTMEYDSKYIICPYTLNEGFTPPAGGKTVPENFSYRSNNNSDILSVDDLRRMIYPAHPENVPSENGGVHA